MLVLLLLAVFLLLLAVFLLWLLFSHIYLGFHTEIHFPTCCWAPVVHGPSVNVPAARMNHPPLGMLLVSDLDCSDDFVFVLNVVFVDQKQKQNRAYSYLLVAYLLMLLFFLTDVVFTLFTAIAVYQPDGGRGSSARGQIVLCA